MAHRPVPTGPVHFFGNEEEGNREPDKELAYLTESLQKFMDRMRGKYEGWDEHMDALPPYRKGQTLKEWMEIRRAVTGG